MILKKQIADICDLQKCSPVLASSWQSASRMRRRHPPNMSWEIFTNKDKHTGCQDRVFQYSYFS